MWRMSMRLGATITREHTREESDAEKPTAHAFSGHRLCAGAYRAWGHCRMVFLWPYDPAPSHWPSGQQRPEIPRGLCTDPGRRLSPGALEGHTHGGSRSKYEGARG